MYFSKIRSFFPALKIKVKKNTSKLAYSHFNNRIAFVESEYKRKLLQDRIEIQERILNASHIAYNYVEVSEEQRRSIYEGFENFEATFLIIKEATNIKDIQAAHSVFMKRAEHLLFLLGGKSTSNTSHSSFTISSTASSNSTRIN